MKNYLITGGAGFIGSNFVKYLYEKETDIHVTVLDKLTYSGNMENLAEVIDREDFEFVKGDICDSGLVETLMEGVHVVVNFAAEVAVDRSIGNTQDFLMTDVIGVYVLLEQALKNRETLEKFIQISTDEVYGQIREGSFYETSELKPRNPYSASKTGGDRLAYSYFATYGLPVCITRASNTYGPFAYPEKVIPLFITNLYEGIPVPVFGDGSQIRDWLYVKDHCSGIYRVIKDGVNGEVYNIGGGQEVTNLDLTKRILSLMGKNESFIRYVSDRPGHDLRYSLNTEKLQALGWQPQYDISSGLSQTVDWYVDHVDYWKKLRAGMDERYFKGFWNEK
ncbi:dTDP-glucose 4,6-dehydratase [Lacrimispora sp. JR3]|uniref:dTDP-glucose 4,6-dehydratase n=1 Tax=Lacrimispora sinapis TaxID=3111456 RepID=UPI003748F362